MLSLLFLVPIALVLTLVAIYFFYWAVKDGQYDDLDRSGRDVLFDEDMQVPHSPKEHDDASR